METTKSLSVETKQSPNSSNYSIVVIIHIVPSRRVQFNPEIVLFVTNKTHKRRSFSSRTTVLLQLVEEMRVRIEFK